MNLPIVSAELCMLLLALGGDLRRSYIFMAGRTIVTLKSKYNVRYDVVKCFYVRHKRGTCQTCAESILNQSIVL